MKYTALVSIIFSYFASPAFADALEFGVGFNCDAVNNRFELVAVTQINDTQIVLSDSADKIQKLGYGTKKIECRIGEENIISTVLVRAGYGGNCTSVGSAEIVSLRVGENVVQQDKSQNPGEPFNWMSSCTSDVLVRLSIFKDQSRIVIERCTSESWGWEKGYAPLLCKRKILK
jgi:hypothetical protein